MTVPTKRVEGSDTDAVWAPIIRSSCIGYQGYHRTVRISEVDEDFEPLKDVLVGLEVCTIFSGKIFGVPSESRVAYAAEVAQALLARKLHREARKFLKITHTFGFYVCKPSMFVFT